MRRSLAALLVDRLGLAAMPRNLARPDGSANYALEPAGDQRLSQWMDERLQLATWVKPEGVVLDDVETAVLLRLRPPLNLDKVGESRERLRRARGVLAAASRTWAVDGASWLPAIEWPWGRTCGALKRSHVGWAVRTTGYLVVGVRAPLARRS